MYTTTEATAASIDTKATRFKRLSPLSMAISPPVTASMPTMGESRAMLRV